MRDHNYYNHSENHEAQYHLRKNNLKQTQNNIDILNKLTPSYATHKEVDKIIKKNLSKFEK
ncbi:TPA: hypothetical protein ACPJIH_001692 [Haemophilus influenzae]|uniref:hypothetical protein n=1 Tax=Haemophilus influenzae TaxID=727 RepID=UPI000CFEE375|nr:hypothetical protein [Haemophilus influenzae]AWP53572.1 hypothetical protein DLJ98_01765 [Haemophilus influenzae]PRI46958.1 hypothetical protein BVZ70_00265 [Haemophilus influenzae]PRI90921.1 hypothetical protein BV021_00068 [Haemophilus influenzae]PRJ58822.1 hypothetical protein BV094_01658 [Haemophilus influenzae]PRJ86722.1 hypothetical protein BV154_00641 [Haemophilus influenzae]